MAEIKETDKPWAQTIRRESGLIEHICKHGCGHPAYGSIVYLNSLTGDSGHGTHGCDECCADPEWKMEDYKEGCQIANQHLAKQVKRLNLYKEFIYNTDPKIAKAWFDWLEKKIKVETEK